MAAPKVGALTVSTRIGARDTAPATLQTHLLDVTPPRLLSATADDPDQDDYVYSAGDTVSIAFDRSTDRGGGAKSGNKAFVDALFAFSEPLAYDCARANAHSCLPALPFGGGEGVAPANRSIPGPIPGPPRDVPAPGRCGGCRLLSAEERLSLLRPGEWATESQARARACACECVRVRACVCACVCVHELVAMICVVGACVVCVLRVS